jgi:hypothetical protein
MAKANVVNTNVVPVETKVFPYYDDFNEDKSFHRILFRPGYAVQARELTQLQTILQNQIERFGQHIFVNGSSVIGGEVKYTPIVGLNLATTYANTTVTPSSFKDKTVKYASGNNEVIARVIQTSNATDTDPPTLFLKYVSGEEFGPGATIKVDGEEIYANLVSTSNVKANGVLAFIEDSIYFYDGYFIKVPKQSVVASKYTPVSNCKIGLELDDSIVTEVSDSSLLDPALESSNYQAPGASRYKADLVLARRELDSIDDEKFIEITRFENGVQRKNVIVPVYSEIEEVFARRTFDESGNYTVRPFRLALLDSTVDTANNFQAVISEGKGYILGFEFESIAPTFIEIPKARTKANVTNYNLNTNFGNYVIVDNLNGDFPLSTMGLVDIHCIPAQFVNRTSSTTYNTTKIGTARVRDIEFFSGDTSVPDRKFEFYIFDVNFSSITGNANATGSTTSTINLFSTATSSNNDAYVGATIRITTGPSAGDQRTIISYNGATRLANVSSPFSKTPLGNTVYSLDFDFAEAESFTRSAFTSGATSNANASITVLNKDNGQANGSTFIFEPSLSSLVFKIPETFIVENSLADQSWMYRRTFTSVSFTSGSATITAGTDEGFEGASSSSNVASTVTDNFLVIVTNPSASGRAVGEQLKVTTSVSAGPPEQATLDTGSSSDTLTATVYAKMDVSGTAATARVKTFVPANTTIFTSESAANTFLNSTGSNTSVYVDAGQVVIRNPSKRANQRESLFLSDVLAIKKIYDLNGTEPTAGMSLISYTDVTGRYSFDNGQKDAYYDHASIRLIPGNAPPVGPLVVCCRYYKTTTDSGYFSVDSYPSLTTNITEEGVNLGTGYAIIPSYKENNLRDCIDYRPVRRNASNNALTYTLGGIKIPIPATDFNTDYEYYLGRRDLIAVSANKTIEHIQGIPNKFPQNPTAPTRSMVLHVLDIPPYTSYPANVSVRFVENKRYTMRDIGLLEKRIENIEYYTNLNTLEKNTLDLQITDVDGLDRTKNGIFVDSFIGHALGDVDSPDYAIATDINGRWSGDGVATNLFACKGVYVDPDIAGSTGVKFGTDIVTLNYTVAPAITQNTATKFTPVADLLFASFEGNILTVPDADIWKETTRNIVINQINIVNEVNLRRFITPPQRDLEQKQLNGGMAPIDVLNNWARTFGTGVGGSNQQVNDRGLQTFGLRGDERFLNTRQINNLNALL